MSAADFDEEELQFLMASNEEDGDGEAMGGAEMREMLVEFRRHKNAYYTNKMHIEPVNK